MRDGLGLLDGERDSAALTLVDGDTDAAVLLAVGLRDVVGATEREAVRLGDALPDAALLPLRDALLDSDAVGDGTVLGDGSLLPLTDDDTVLDAGGDAEARGEALPEDDTDLDARLYVGVTLGDARDADRVSDAVNDADTDGVDVATAVTVLDRVTLGDTLGVAVFDLETDPVGVEETDLDLVGEAVRDADKDGDADTDCAPARAASRKKRSSASVLRALGAKGGAPAGSDQRAPPRARRAWGTCRG